MWNIKWLDLTTKKQTLMENLAVLHSFVGTGPKRDADRQCYNEQLKWHEYKIVSAYARRP
jgi:hypothetical protein